MAMTIAYEIENKLYLNITNKCPCSCTFCIRSNADGVYGSSSLWLDHEPTVEEIKEALAKYKLNEFKEVVFCGYGEPLERLDIVIEIGKYIKNISNATVRINTNGLSDLINNKSTSHLLKDSLDIVSISLNAGDEKEYYAVTNPSFENAFAAMLKFAEECKVTFPKVMFTVVDVISEEQIDKSKKIADKLGIPLRVRKYDK